jgi:predicted PurR-regulated permease PerM
VFAFFLIVVLLLTRIIDELKELVDWLKTVDNSIIGFNAAFDVEAARRQPRISD